MCECVTVCDYVRVCVHVLMCVWEDIHAHTRVHVSGGTLVLLAVVSRTLTLSRSKGRRPLRPDPPMSKALRAGRCMLRLSQQRPVRSCLHAHMLRSAS